MKIQQPNKHDVQWDSCIRCSFDENELKDSLLLFNVVHGHIATGENDNYFIYCLLFIIYI